MKKTLFVLLISSLIVTVSFTLIDDSDDFEISKNLDIYYTMIRELNIYYVDKPDAGTLITKSINALLKELDPYTVYIPESRIEDYKTMSTGEYGGIGVLINRRTDKVVIAEIYEGAPAKEAGLKVGDEILSISGQSVNDLNMDDIGKLLKGSANSVVKMKIKRPGANTFVVDVSRNDIKIKNVPYFGMLDNEVGYIKLRGFTMNASAEVKNAFKALQEQGMKSLVFDLRGNPGGLLIEAVGIVNIFVPQNQMVVKMIGRVEQWNHDFYTKEEPLDTQINVVVLIDRMSASASEIVSGALQDLDRAVILGERSYGKGLVQTTRPLTYNAQLKLTTAKYYIPSGRCIQALDYSNRNEDGSVGRIADSLISEFKTANGRIVFDGGGILPDVEHKVQTTPKLMEQLNKENVIFDYVTSFLIQNNLEFESAEDVYYDENKYFNDFIKFAANKGFSYETQREASLEKLIKSLEEEKHYEFVKQDIINLKNKLAHNLDKDLNIFKKEIDELIEEELAVRYYYQNGRIIQSLNNDFLLFEAIKLVKNDIEIRQILKLE